MKKTAASLTFLTRFKCLGAECEDTCCKGWNMQVDRLTQDRYRAQAPELMQSLVREGDAAIMRRNPETDYCVKFEGGLCGIQAAHGEEFLGDACSFYPRSTRKLGEAITMTATLSCPEIARLSLFDEGGFKDSEIALDRLPQTLNDYLPEGITSPQAKAIHRLFLELALREDVTAEHSLVQIYRIAESLSRITTAAWPDAVPFYAQHAGATLSAPEPRATDTAYLVQALCGLVAAAKYVHHARLVETIEDMQRALHITIHWDTLAIASLPGSEHALQCLHANWRDKWRQHFALLLKRYLAMQLSLALFPFAGFGETLPQRAAVIGIRMATVRLGLMSLCDAAHGLPAQKDVVRVVQSLSRFLDHLGSAEFSLKIYEETGWLKGPRLRGLLENN